jgi:hypothetical protein
MMNLKMKASRNVSVASCKFCLFITEFEHVVHYTKSGRQTPCCSCKMLEVKKKRGTKHGFVQFLRILISYVHPGFGILSPLT